ncbi:hypothetical protein BDN72DRAFT_682696 [Pluteus cervinus]|uniref:Uncharacterized protein n=1 Tax=Pluteus cervinus TaxID=181527 RepID=A0ACD3AS02_9AGAR|nr:hypothetical protein BDN72DRAFT_682696 [Pluteus cervinus]
MFVGYYYLMRNCKCWRAIGAGRQRIEKLRTRQRQIISAEGPFSSSFHRRGLASTFPTRYLLCRFNYHPLFFYRRGLACALSRTSPPMQSAVQISFSSIQTLFNTPQSQARFHLRNLQVDSFGTPQDRVLFPPIDLHPDIPQYLDIRLPTAFHLSTLAFIFSQGRYARITIALVLHLRGLWQSCLITLPILDRILWSNGSLSNARRSTLS